MTNWTPDKYETVAERDGLKFEVVRLGHVSLFGEQLYQACTFGIEMVPIPIRRVLGTFTTRHEAEATALHAHGETVREKE